MTQERPLKFPRGATCRVKRSIILDYFFCCNNLGHSCPYSMAIPGGRLCSHETAAKLPLLADDMPGGTMLSLNGFANEDVSNPM